MHWTQPADDSTDAGGCVRRSVGMAQTVCVLPPAQDRGERLPGHRREIAIVHLNMCSGRALSLCSADRFATCRKWRGARERRRRPAVWRWQARYAEQGVEGLLRDRTRKPGRAPLSAKVVAKVMDHWTCSEPPGHATHWTGTRHGQGRRHGLRAGCSGLVAGASVCSRTAFAPSSAPTILSSPGEGRGHRRPLHGTLLQARWSSRSTRRRASPGARPHATGLAAQARKNAGR